MIGAAIAGAAASAAGPIIGSVIDYYSAKAARNASRNAANSGVTTAQNAYNSANAQNADIDSYVNQYKNLLAASGYSDDDIANYASQYQSALASLGNSENKYKATDFDYDKSVEDFYDKAWKTNNDTQLQGLANSAANAGGLYGSGLQKQMASTTSANATNAYKDALSAYEADKGLAENTWAQQNTNLLNQANSNMNNASALTNAYNNALATGLNNQSELTSAQIQQAQNKQNLINNYANIGSQLASSGATKSLSLA
jgi:hypothetical protein